MLKAYLGPLAVSQLGINIIKIGSEEVCLISCKRGSKEVWCRHPEYNRVKHRLLEKMAKKHDIFYIRYPKGSEELETKEAYSYIAEHFPQN
jgi:hypothetical protein